jgi:ABC-type dipeptide/oligopeptide/nickel transport system permease component
MTNGIMVGGFSLQLQWLLLLGVLIVALAVWSDAFTRIFPRWLGPEADPMARLRLMRLATVSLTAFVSFLYIPYLLGSNWFWLGLSQASHVIGPLRGFGNWLENLEMPILALGAIWQYSITQVLACAALVFFAWALARPAKRPRKIR